MGEEGANNRTWSVLLLKLLAGLEHLPRKHRHHHIVIVIDFPGTHTGP